MFSKSCFLYKSLYKNEINPEATATGWLKKFEIKVVHEEKVNIMINACRF